MQVNFENFLETIKKSPLWIKLCFGFILGTAVTGGIIELPKLTENISQEEVQEQLGNTKELINVDLLVFSEENTSLPLQDTKITFISKGSPIIKKTDSAGFVQINIPERSDIEITLVKDGYQEARYTIDLKNDPDRTRTFYLTPQP